MYTFSNSRLAGILGGQDMTLIQICNIFGEMLIQTTYSRNTDKLS